MSNKINLFYYTKNFGDELSAYLVRKLSGKTVRFCYPLSIKRILRNYIAFFHLLLTGKKPSCELLTAYSLKPVLVAVGSLLESVNRHCIVWGTGMAQSTLRINPGRVIMTRGFLSQKIVENMGGQVLNKECGDPALLLPLIYNPDVEKKYDITIIPHRSHYERMKEDIAKSHHHIHIVNLTVESEVDIEAIIKEIKQSRFILSSSLHGIIVAHAYGIPALRVYFEDLPGGDFKFKDYFSSVDIPYYTPLDWKQIIAANMVKKTAELEDEQAVESDKLHMVQKALLRNFPYALDEKIKMSI